MGTDGLALFLCSLGGTEKYRVMHAFASISGCPQHMKASLAGDTPRYAY